MAGRDFKIRPTFNGAGIPTQNEAVLKTLVDAKGDLIVASAADVVGRLAPGSNGQVLTADSAEALGVKWATDTDEFSMTFSKAGTLAVGAGTHRWYADKAYTIVQVRASVGTQPTGASILIDVNKNGTTIFTTQSNRPTIAVSTNTDLADSIEVSSLASGDYLTVDIDQIGSTIAGADLTVQVLLRRA